MTDEPKDEQERKGTGRRENDEELSQLKTRFSKDIQKIKLLTKLQLITGLLALVAFVLVIVEFSQVQSNQANITTLVEANRLRTIENHTLATKAVSLGQEIEQERIQAALQNCRDTNTKHRRTVAALDFLQKKMSSKETAAQREQATTSRGSIIFFINAFEPLRKNCYQYALHLTQRSRTPGLTFPPIIPAPHNPKKGSKA